MRETLSQNPMSEALEAGKAPFQVIRRIREAILDGTFEPGDRLLEDDLAERFSSAGLRFARRCLHSKMRAQPLWSHTRGRS
jgi:hypothetical protein